MTGIEGRRNSSRLKALVAGCFLAAIVFAGCRTESNKSAGVPIEGNDSYEASLYRQNCAVCHGKEALGKIVNGQLVPGLRYGDAAKRSDEEIYRQISNGKLPMPSFRGQLTESEIRRMVIFIRKDLQGRTGENRASAK